MIFFDIVTPSSKDRREELEKSYLWCAKYIRRRSLLLFEYSNANLDDKKTIPNEYKIHEAVQTKTKKVPNFRAVHFPSLSLA